MGVGTKRLHALSGRFVEVGKNNVAAEQIRGVMRHCPSEKLGKYQTHYYQKKQRLKHAPAHS